MEWITLGIVVGVALWTYFKMPKIPKITEKPRDIECPMCEDGAPIPVVFGTVCIKGANVTWWGGVETGNVVSGDNDGRIVYRLSMRMALCHGALDSIVKIFVGGQDLQIAPIASDQRFFIRRSNLLGGGAIVGDLAGNIYARMGYNDFLGAANSGVYSKPSEIAGETAGLGPGFFGIACAELESMWVGGSPYLQPWAFVVQRILKRNSASPLLGHSDQWYEERAYIPHGITAETKWWHQDGDGLDVPTGDMADWLAANMPDDDDGWYGLWPMPFGQGTAPSGLPSVTENPEVDFGWRGGKHFWAKTIVVTDPIDAKEAGNLYLFVYCENAAWVWVDGQYVGATNSSNTAQNGSSANFDVTDLLKPRLVPSALSALAGAHTIIMYCLDEDPADEPASTYVYARIVTSPVVANNVDAATLYSYRDMNPAHIVRECLSDPVWGMGYLDADIDEDSFTASADTLYEEGFGLSILWSEPCSIEEFINEILRHINGTLYMDRSTGKYKLTLVREGYDLDSLVSLDESTIERIDDVSRRATGDLINQVSVSYTSSAMGDDSLVTVTESGLVQSQGAVINRKIDFPGITTHELASRVALRELKSLSAPSTSCIVIANRAAAVLNPGEPFKVTWPEFGFDETVFRVASIELGDGRTNRVRIRCVEDVFANPEHNVLAPPSTPWTEPTATPIAVPDPVFVDTYQYKSTFKVAKLSDPALKTEVDCVFCESIPGPAAVLFNQNYPNKWEEIRPGVWRAREVGEALPTGYTHGIRPFAGMRVLAAWLGDSVDPTNLGLEAEDGPRTGIYVFTDPGYSWDEATRQYTSTYAQLERADDFISGAQLTNGCVVRIKGGVYEGTLGELDFTGKYARLTTTGAITIGTTALDWELLSSYTAVRGDNLLTEAQAALYGDGHGDTLNLSATAAEPGVWIAFPTLVGTPNAQTYPAGRTRWTFRANFVSGDTSETSTIECQIVKYVAIDNVTVLAEAESDPIVGGHPMAWGKYVTHADVNDDQLLSGGRLAVRYRLTTTSASQVVVTFEYGDMFYETRVDTPLTLGQSPTFPHTPYGEAIALDENGILTIPDLDMCSGEVRVSGSIFKGISIADAKGNGFVGGDKLSIRLTEDCYVHNSESVASGAAGLDLSTFGGLSGDDADLDCGPRSCLVLQYDDLVGAWELAATPMVKEKTA